MGIRGISSYWVHGILEVSLLCIICYVCGQKLSVRIKTGQGLNFLGYPMLIAKELSKIHNMEECNSKNDQLQMITVKTIS